MTGWTQPGFAASAALVNRRSGLALDSRRESAEQAMRRAMARLKLPDAGAYADRLSADDAALDELLGELTVGETYFFREPAHFQFIQERILPEIMARRGPAPALRAWSAGCASGEEAYSLAILLAQAGLDHAHLVATDINRHALMAARNARYTAWSLRGDGAIAARPHLVPSGKEYRLDEAIRRRVLFAHLNLALDAYPSFSAGIWAMDLILCRNVLIYFDADTVQRTAQRLFASLADGGWLITASSDPPLWEHAPFEVVADANGLFYRRPMAPAVDFPAPVQLDAPDLAPPSAEPAAIPVAESGDAIEDAVHEVRELARRDAGAALAVCDAALKRHPLAAALHVARAALLLDVDRGPEAEQALKRAIYLDRGLAIAHFMLAAALRRKGDLAGARRGYRNARDLCARRPLDEPAQWADGETSGRLAEIAAAELALLQR